MKNRYSQHAETMGNFTPYQQRDRGERSTRFCQWDGCGTRLRRGNPGPYCSACSVAHEAPVAPTAWCEWCQAAYTTLRAQQRYCSGGCATASRHAADRARKQKGAAS